MEHSSLRKQFENGCLLPRQTIIVELHRLAAIFLASEKFAELRGGRAEGSYQPMTVLQAGEAHEIKRILVSCAAAIRGLDDYLDQVSDMFAYDCGDITDGLGVTGELSVREACNKILHASRMEPGLGTLANGNLYFDGTLTLWAVDPKRKKHTWEARIGVIAFVRESTRYLETFEV